MRYVLAELTRRNISIHYYQKQNGNRAFTPFGMGPIPLAISYQYGRYSIGKAAYLAVEEGQKDAYYNLFDVDMNQSFFDGLLGRHLVPKVITILLEDLCLDKFSMHLADAASEITLVLFYGNDINYGEIDRVSSGMTEIPFAGVEVIDHSQESVKFFHKGTVDDWSGENDGMVVMSDNQDFSVKCYSLSDYKLKYEHRFKGKGVDPRFEWAVKTLYRTLNSLTYCDESTIPIVEKTVKEFLASDKMELRSVRLPDGNWPVMLTKRQYNLYSPPGGNQFVTIAGDVVRQANLTYENTGIVLQGYAAENKSFRDSFVSFDPRSDENETMSREIRNGLLGGLLGINESIEIDCESVECPWEGGPIKIGVKSSPANLMYEAATSVDWIELLQGANSIIVDVKRNESNLRRFGEVNLTSAYGNFKITLKVIQLAQTLVELPLEEDVDDDGKRKFNMSYSLSSDKRKQQLTVKAEILEGKALPFDCMFTLDTNNFMTYKPQESFCEECERGKKGVMEFGPYELPIQELGPAKTLYAHIWPIDKTKSPNLFRKNHLKITL